MGHGLDRLHSCKGSRGLATCRLPSLWSLSGLGRKGLVACWAGVVFGFKVLCQVCTRVCTCVSWRDSWRPIWGECAQGVRTRWLGHPVFQRHMPFGFIAQLACRTTAEDTQERVLGPLHLFCKVSVGGSVVERQAERKDSCQPQLLAPVSLLPCADRYSTGRS